MFQPGGQPEENTDSTLIMINDENDVFERDFRIKDLIPYDDDAKRQVVPGSEYISITSQGRQTLKAEDLKLRKWPQVLIIFSKWKWKKYHFPNIFSTT